jgi:P27 family predicted phage terminase small subunit
VKPGPPPTPANLRILRGNPSRRPVPQGEPQPPPTPTCPEAPSYLDTYAREEWQRVAPLLFTAGLLSTIDVAILSVYCAAFSQWRTATEMLAAAATDDPETANGLLVERDSGMIPNPLIGIARRAADQVLRTAVEFAMSPAARARMGAGPSTPKPPGKFDGLIA